MVLKSSNTVKVNMANANKADIDATITNRAFIFENVEGILRPYFADYFNSIISRFSDLAYKVHKSGKCGRLWRSTKT
jgi:site-specific DNA-cytosine methylase